MRHLYARIVCRLRGHRMVELVRYDKRRVLVGIGCAREGCGHGTVHERRRKGPMPRDAHRVVRLPTGRS